MLTAYQQHLENTYIQFKQTLLTKSLIDCDFKVGDFVTFTNENGVFFREPKRVIGFDDGTTISGDRFIYTESDAYWFPSLPAQLDKVEKTQTGCLLVREVTHLPLYEFENEISFDPNWSLLISEGSLHCVWSNDARRELVTYVEGDIIWTTALDETQYGSEIRRVIDFFNEC